MSEKIPSLSDKSSIISAWKNSARFDSLYNSAITAEYNDLFIMTMAPKRNFRSLTTFLTVFLFQNANMLIKIIIYVRY